MKVFIFFAKSREYLQAAKQWFFKTSERALNRSYTAALFIKSLESEYFCGDEISTNSTQDNSQNNNFRMFLSQVNFVKNFIKLLSVIQLGLIEFKVSDSILSFLGSSKSTHAENLKRIRENVEKLRVIDKVLNKYISKRKFFWVQIFQKNKKNPSKVHAPSYSKTIEVPATKIPFE
ncbi:MAG: hypothetical protein HC862_22195 [Scytonema sp. RU_4_4]|nr:hypothetical protein [Scytonema sp. RU_4_4]